VPGTLAWVFAEYRADRRYTKLDARTKRNHEVGFRIVGGYVLKDGRRLGTLRLAAIDTSLAQLKQLAVDKRYFRRPPSQKSESVQRHAVGNPL
jgi:hypothetical protein